MRHYKQQYKQRLVSYLVLTLLGLLSGNIFMGCHSSQDVRTVRDCYAYTNPPKIVIWQCANCTLGNRLDGDVCDGCTLPREGNELKIPDKKAVRERTYDHESWQVPIQPTHLSPEHAAGKITSERSFEVPPRAVAIQPTDSIAGNQVPKIKQPVLNFADKSVRGEPEWECADCTFYNPLHTNTCEICGTLRKIDQYTEWTCQACTFINPSSEKTCGGCNLESADDINISLLQIKPKDRKEIEGREECPVCLEEGNLQKQEKNTCKQCKKAICELCYQHILKSKNKLCPLCRYEKY